VADDVTIRLGVEDDASGPIGDLQDQADRLDGTTAKLTVDADTADAQSGLTDVDQAASELDARDVNVKVESSVDLGDLRRANDAMDSVEKRAGKVAHAIDRLGTGSRTSGNRIADLAGPLGDASSTASTAGGVFDGLGDIVEDLGGKFGLSEAAVGNLSGALGGLGLVVAAGAALWTLYRQNQQKAEAAAKAAAEAAQKAADAQGKMNDQLAQGKASDAAETLLSTFKDLAPAVHDLGLQWGDVVDFIGGNAPNLLDPVNQQISDLQARLKDMAGQGIDLGADPEAQRIVHLVDKLSGARDAIDNVNQAEAQGTGIREQHASDVAAIAAAYGAVAQNAGDVLYTIGPTGDLIETVGGQAQDASDHLANLSIQMQALANQLDISAALHSTQAAINDVNQGMVAYAQAVKEHGKNSAEAQAALFNLQGQATDAEQSLITVADQLGGFPPEVETQFKAAIERGDLATAQRLLTDLAKDRDAQLKPIVNPPAADKAKTGLDLIAKDRDTDIYAHAEPQSANAAEHRLDGVAANRTAPIHTYADPASLDAAQRKIDAAARDRTMTISVQYNRPPRLSPTPGDLVPNMAPAGAVGAEPITAGGGLGRTAAAPAVAAFPIYGTPAAAGGIQIHVDARGAIDPYAVGRQVQATVAEWRRVGGTWSPGGIR